MFCSLLGMLPTMKNLQRLQIRQKEKLKKNLIQLSSKPHLPMEIFKTQIPGFTQTPSLKVECLTDDDVWNPVDVVIDLRA